MGASLLRGTLPGPQELNLSWAVCWPFSHRNVPEVSRALAHWVYYWPRSHFLYTVIAAESSAWKPHFTPDYQPLEMTQDLYVASPQIFFLACLDLEVSEGLHNKPTFCALVSLLPARAAPAKFNYRAPSQATPNIRNLLTCPSLCSSRLCCFSRAFL